MQALVQHCADHNIELRVVVDAAFQELLATALPSELLLLYPRKQIKQSKGAWQKARVYLNFLLQLRQFKADLAFNIEEDSVSHRLTQFSGAAYRLGCSTARHGWGYDRVLPIDFSKRSAEQQHRWYSFAAVFAAVGVQVTAPIYLQFPLRPAPEALMQKMQALRLNLEHGIVAVHAGATKKYKMWPLSHFVELIERIVQTGKQVVLIGSGADADNINAIVAQLSPACAQGVVNACNQFALAELVHFFRYATFVIGNDSGPFHLASALHVKGAVIFGPTDVRLWGPLSPQSVVLKGTEPCSADCTRKQCLHQHRCLWSIKPANVLQQMQAQLAVVAEAPTASRTS